MLHSLAFALAICLIAASSTAGIAYCGGERDMTQSTKVDQPQPPVSSGSSMPPREAADALPARAVPPASINDAQRQQDAGRVLMMMLLNGSRSRPFGGMSH